MNRFLLLFTLICFGFQSNLSLADKYIDVLNDYIDAYNNKNKTVMNTVLHKDFVQYYRDDVSIKSKGEFWNYFASGKVLKDYFEIKVALEASNLIITKSKYYSQKDSILMVGPYKSVSKFYFKDNKIIKIVDDDEIYVEENKLMYERYKEFFEWVKKSYSLKFSDFPFTKDGAEKLLPFLEEFMASRKKQLRK